MDQNYLMFHISDLWMTLQMSRFSKHFHRVLQAILSCVLQGEGAGKSVQNACWEEVDYYVCPVDQ